MMHDPTRTDQRQMMKALNELEQAGFKRINKRWFRRSAETIVVVDLQRSSYSALYYLSVAVWLLPLGDPSNPPREEQCHLRTRINDTARTGALDLEQPMQSDDRQQLITRIVVESVLPLAEQCRTIAGCRAAVNEGTFEAVTRVARELLA
jgi:hypothetical protein